MFSIADVLLLTLTLLPQWTVGQLMDVHDLMSAAVDVCNRRSYEVEYVIKFPSRNSFHAQMTHYPTHLWVDMDDPGDPKIRMQTFDGLGKLIFTTEGNFRMHPSVDGSSCIKQEVNTDFKSRFLISGKTMIVDSCESRGMKSFEHQECHLFECSETTAPTADPIFLCMSRIHGQPLFIWGIDDYVMHVTQYLPGQPDSSAFELPQPCKDHQQHSGSEETNQELPVEIGFMQLIPRVIGGHPAYDAFVKRHNRVLLTPFEYEWRLGLFLKHRRFIEMHNSQSDDSYQLEENMYMDWADDEFLSLRTGLAPLTKETRILLSKNARAYRRYPRKKIPPYQFSWQGTGADGYVKDQGFCSASYAFGASQVMTGAWFIKHSQSISFSEQLLIDCTWQWGNFGCEGGRPELALIAVMQSDPLPMTEQAYPLNATDNSCNFVPRWSFGSFKSLGYPSRGLPEVTQLVLTEHGPIATAVDPSFLDFKFYRSGVYSNPNCASTAEEDLKHTVGLMGYGQQDGKKYWLIKNSWGATWGEGGYMKVDMEYDCGITLLQFYIDADSLPNEHHHQPTA